MLFLFLHTFKKIFSLKIGLLACFLLAGFLVANPVQAANRFWVGGGSSANWSATTPTNWSATSGGSNNASVPTSSDDVFFNGVGGGASNSTLSADITIRSLNMTGYINTLTHNAGVTLSIGDGTAGASSNALIFGSLTYTLGNPATSAIWFISTSATAQNVNFNGKTSGNIVFDGVGGSWKLTGNLVTGNTATVHVNNGTLDGNGNNLTMGSFESNNGNIRTITMGSGTWTVTGSNSTVWNMADMANATFNRGNPVVFNYAGGTGTRLIDHGQTSGVESNSLSINITAGTDTISSNFAETKWYNTDFTGFSGTADLGYNNIYGNLTIGSTTTMLSNSQPITFKATSGTKTITTNGVPMATAAFLVFDGVGGTWQLVDNLTADEISLVNGTFNANSKNVTVATFYSSNAGIRTLTMGSGTWTVSNTYATILSTGLTLNRGNPIVMLGQHIYGSASEATSNDFNFTSSDAADISWGIHNLDFTGYTNSVYVGIVTIYGNLTLSSGMTLITTADSSLAFGTTSGTKTITSNGKTLDFPVSFNGVGGTWQLADNLSVGTSTPRQISLVAGTLDLSSHTLTHYGVMSIVNGLATSIIGSGTYNNTLDSASTVWNVGRQYVAQRVSGSETDTVDLTNVTVGNTLLVWVGTEGGTTTGVSDGSNTYHSVNSSSVGGSKGNLFYTVVTTGGDLEIIASSSGNTNVIVLEVAGASSSPIDVSGVSNGSASYPQTIPLTLTQSGAIYSFWDNKDETAPTAVASPLDNLLDVVNGDTDQNDADAHSLSLSAGTYNASSTAGTDTPVNSAMVAVALKDASGSTTFTTSGTWTLKISGSTANARTFVGGGVTYPNFWFTNATANGQLTITGNNTFSDFKANDTNTQTILFTAGSTTHVTTFTVSGAVSHLITLNSTTTGTFALVKDGGGTITTDYLSIQHSVATPSNTWYPGSHTTNNQSVTTAGSGWVFNANPTFVSISNTTGSIHTGGMVTFTAVASDSDVSDTITLYVCKANNFTGTACGTGGEWAHSTASTTNPTASYTILSADGSGSHTYYANIIDSNNAQASSNAISGTFSTDATLPGQSTAVGYGGRGAGFFQSIITPTPSTVTNPLSPVAHYVFTRYLGYTDHGDDVLNLQKLLQSLGFFPANIAPNGYYGPTTKASVKHFQQVHHINQTGNVGPLTLLALNSL